MDKAEISANIAVMGQITPIATDLTPCRANARPKPIGFGKHYGDDRQACAQRFDGNASSGL
ncbi:hypothetical protein [Novosphingobium sp.]|uniref:hypothetical protein n=1 Tax=Novosphingobium sp. TaxID=1874826 RepID=UPI003BA9BB10